MSDSGGTNKHGASAFLLAEEAVQLILRAGLAPLSVYAIGTVPFVLGLVAYVGAMAHSGIAHIYVGTGALGLALLFMWMKAFQARFAQHLRAELRDTALTPWSVRAFFSSLCRQAFIHASVVIVYPVAFVTVLPMGFAAALYQNTSVLDDGSPQSARALATEALAQARLWPKQNHILLWLCSPLMVCVGTGVVLGTLPILDNLEDQFLVSLGFFYAVILLLAALPVSPFAVITFVNISSALFLVIELFHILTGADSLFSRNPGAVIQNDLFLSVVCGITYMLLDPILKAAYTIRCHEGESLTTGADLRVGIRRIRQAAACVLIVATVAMALPAESETPANDAQVAPLNQAIDDELSARRYTWRMPREEQPDVALPWLLQLLVEFGESVRGWMKAAFDFIADAVEAIWDWFFGGGGSDAGGGSPSSFNRSIRFLVGILAGALIAVTLYLVWRAYRDRETKALIPINAAEGQAPDLEDEATTAADLPQDEWLQLAQELAGKGDFRLASRALFFSILAILADREVIRIARFKSNMDYDSELTRRASSIGNAPQLFSRSAFLYESVWYGKHEATSGTVESLFTCQEEMRHGLQ
jgi:hypothetical protein